MELWSSRRTAGNATASSGRQEQKAEAKARAAMMSMRLFGGDDNVRHQTQQSTDDQVECMWMSRFVGSPTADERNGDDTLSPLPLLSSSMLTSHCDDVQ